MNLGIVLVLITALGYASNWLNWKFLNYRITHLLYYVGALVHETSHAVLCLLTRAPIHEYVVFSTQPHVTSGPSRIPVVGSILINIAPIIGGLGFLFLVDHYLFASYFVVPAFTGWQDIANGALALLSQLRPWQWQSWVMILLFLNVGAMIGPSTQDLKNIWIPIILLFFVDFPPLADLGFLAVALIVVNIAIQLLLIAVIKTAQAVF